uniref:Fignl1 interacting regulator of recombination and mitosis n=1 Tax=Callorhinchus milii TaxID=7868 RepID=A0A4W3JCY3_CALMI
MFLPLIDHADLEQTLFSQVLPKAITMFDELMNKLSSQARGLSSQNTDLQAALKTTMQTQIQLLEILMNCGRYVCTFKEALPLNNIHSLSSAILHVLKNAFGHCKESETLYSSRMHLVSDVLQSLFKETYSLQKQFMEMLDCVCLLLNVVYSSVIHSVLEICSVVSKMDHALHANTWKFLIKISVKHRALLDIKLRHDDIVAGLCEDILFSFNSCLQFAEQMHQSGAQVNMAYKLFQKTMKLCRFFANTLVHYLKEFIDFLSKSCHQLHKLYLQMYSKFPSSLYAPVMSEGHWNEIACTVLVALDPLISQLLPFRAFVETVLADKPDPSLELAFPQCLLLVNVMDKLPSQPQEVESMWCAGSQFSEETPRLSLFQALFFNIQHCYAELSLPVQLPGVMIKGQAQHNISLYEYVCVHLCSFVTFLPASIFPDLCSLLDAVLGPHMLTALLATDTWCFLARYGTAELCAHHVSLIAQLVKSCHGECYQLSHLSVLLRRLLFLMAADHQIVFVKRFCPKEADNLLVWQQISIKALPPDLQKQVASDIARTAVDQCVRWQRGKHVLGELEQVNVALAAMVVVCHIHGEAMELELQMSITRSLSQMWAVLTVAQVRMQHIPPRFHSMVSSLSSILPLHPPDHIRLATLDFLGSLGKIFIPSDVQGFVLPKLPGLFASLLVDKCWLIHQQALQGFTQFAEETSHEEVVPRGLESAETKAKVVNFLNKPSAKRARQEPCEEEHYQTVLQTAEHALNTLQTLLQQGPAPEWVTARLQGLQTTITSLNKRIHAVGM